MSIDTYIASLTLEEKALLLQGASNWETHAIARLGIPAMFLSDGPHGLRRQSGSADHLGLNASDPATCFPTAATMANSWSPELGEALGRALGKEAAASGVHVVLGPGLNMKRSPLCGRNFEYFSEDPYLAGKMAAAYIRGIQENGTAACPKHFAVNSQETRRLSTDSVVDERTLREIYLTAFEIAVKEGHPKAIMSSYNPVNGTYANENPHLLQDILRKDWGFGGFVMSDWGGSNDHAAGVRAGSALEMPNPGLDSAIGLVESVKKGETPEADLDARLRELLPVVLSTAEATHPGEFDREAHHALARKCAAESIVLLENDGILPLAPGTRTALIGSFAETPRYQGAGSSRVNPTRIDTLKDSLAGCGLYLSGYAKGFGSADSGDALDLIDEAVRLALGAEVVLLCLGLDDRAEMEGLDRRHMRLPEDQLALLRAVSRVNSNIVLVLSGGAPFVMPDPSVYRAAIHGYLSGQAGAGAMADVLTGRTSPSGKLSETWPLALEDTPCYRYYPGRQATAEHREGLYIGYRYYDTTRTPVRYPFGHGLSYTTFSYTGMEADQNAVRFTLTNTGAADGAEIAQVYISCRNGRVFRPKKELKGFAKVFLKAGESRRVTIPLDDKAWRYWNVKTGRWEIEDGDYDIYAAASAADIRLTAAVHISGTGAPAPYGSLPCYESGCVTHVPDGEFEALLGHPIPDAQWKQALHRNDAVSRLVHAKSPLMRLVGRKLQSAARTATPDDPQKMNMMYTFHAPLRGAAKLGGGVCSEKMVEDLVHIANGHTVSGLFRLCVHHFSHRRRCREFRNRLDSLNRLSGELHTLP